MRPFLFGLLNIILNICYFCKSLTEQPNDCVGSTDGVTKVGYSESLDLLRKQYSGCTVVFGSVIIAHLQEYGIRNRSMLEMEKELDFLNDIEQITGSLIIFATHLESISFKKLKIIWGDELHEGMSVLIEGNDYLRHLRLPSLRSVERGNITINSNPYLCHLEKTVSFYEIVGRDAEKRVWRNNESVLCYMEAEPKCHPNCGQYCWGPEEDNCQIIYRENCSPDCHSGMCHFGGSNEPLCCDDACAAGCTGKGSSHCVACKRLSQDGQCVDRCNGLTSYDIVKMMTVAHEKPRYTHNRFCVPECPGTTIIENENCVHRCSEGSSYDGTKPYTCKPCKNGICPKSCELNDPINSQNIETLRGCTTIEGYLYLPPQAFKVQSAFPDDLTHLTFEEMSQFNNTDAVIPPLREEQLEILSTVRVVTGFVEISLFEHSPESLSFLRNLETIIGRIQRARYSLKIFRNANLKYLGLKSLKQIVGGRVYITDNQALCYADTQYDTWDQIIQEVPEPGHRKFRIERNRQPTLCQLQGKVCNDSCDEAYGCWGPGDAQCVQCKYFYDGERCLYECSSNGYYIDGKNCSRCSEECVDCHGPLDEDCYECKHVSLQQGSRKQCLPKCPSSHYNSNGTCLPCHPACYDFGCSGDSDLAGPGGCNRCRYGVELNNMIRCLSSKNDSALVCKDNHFDNYFVHLESTELIKSYKCIRCPDECLSCTGFGTDVVKHGCECVNYMTHATKDRNYCTNECEVGSYMMEAKTKDRIGYCHICHEYCDRSYNCVGNNATDCERCRFAGVIDDKNKQTCLKECPEGMHTFQGKNNICYFKDPAAVLQRKRQIVVLSIVTVFTAIALGLAWNCWKYRLRYKREMQLNPPALPEYEPMDPNVRPNMNQLRLISSEQLTKTSRPLGKGAFGIVYAGYWWPNRKGGEKVVVAIKVVQDPTGQAQKEMLAEAGIMASMRHEHLLRLVGVCLSNGIQLVTPLRPLGSLREFLIKHHQKLGARDLLLYCFQIASAMEYLFKNRLVHRDLAARNVLVKRTNHVEVTDFGLAKMLEKGKNEIIVNGKVAVKWLAIESLRDRIYNHATDVWAFGVTCWEILTFGQTPYSNLSFDRMLPYLESGNRLEQPNNCTQEVYQVLVQCWLENPDSRPTFVILKNYFDSFCRVPHRYIVLEQVSKFTPESFDCKDQRELINELMEDNDFTDPLAYFDEHDDQITENTTVPITPTTPPWSINNDPSAGGCDTILLNRQGRRLTSTGSTRYQSDPVHGDIINIGINTDEGNYLVPNTKQSATLYTPVVVNENGESELLTSPQYYNENKSPEYYNDLKIIDDKLPMIHSIANKDYFAGTETSL